MIELLMRLQNGGVQLSGTEDLSKLLNLSPNLEEEWSPHLIFYWYGSTPSNLASHLIDLNSDSQSKIKSTLNWPEGRVRRLIRARQQKPLKNLADLQERLSLSASTIESLIGCVSFGGKSAGPFLPPY